MFDGLNEIGFQEFLCLDAWFPVCGNVKEGLGVMALLEEMYHWAWALGFENSMQGQLF